MVTCLQKLHTDFRDLKEDKQITVR